MNFRQRLGVIALCAGLLFGCSSPCSTSPDPCCTTPTTTYCMAQQACIDAPTPTCCATYVPNGSFAIFDACLVFADGGVADGGDGG